MQRSQSSNVRSSWGSTWPTYELIHVGAYDTPDGLLLVYYRNDFSSMWENAMWQIYADIIHQPQIPLNMSTASPFSVCGIDAIIINPKVWNGCRLFQFLLIISISDLFQPWLKCRSSDFWSIISLVCLSPLLMKKFT